MSSIFALEKPSKTRPFAIKRRVQLYIRGAPNDLGLRVFPPRMIHAKCGKKWVGVFVWVGWIQGSWKTKPTQTLHFWRAPEHLPITCSGLVFLGYIFWGSKYLQTKGVWMYRGKSIQITIRLHCLIPPVWVIWRPPDESPSPQKYCMWKNVVLMGEKIAERHNICIWPIPPFFRIYTQEN